MKDFSKLFEEYMMMDKKTLAQILAMRDLREQEEKNISPFDIQPYYPYYPAPITPIQPYYGGEWTITCQL